MITLERYEDLLRSNHLSKHLKEVFDYHHYLQDLARKLL